eukprot:TRINITY_DN60276_c0_g1_i1.p1 TRINITY_DN60276_c0_g1~~TRINITY_DN60276_c0_g1_i1.p1  ORF type:complete len:202 (+),score=17.06 TRINITY_DN60276_c0_g1_i1:69-674(+)
MDVRETSASPRHTGGESDVQIRELRYKRPATSCGVALPPSSGGQPPAMPLGMPVPPPGAGSLQHGTAKIEQVAAASLMAKPSSSPRRRPSTARVRAARSAGDGYIATSSAMPRCWQHWDLAVRRQTAEHVLKSGTIGSQSYQRHPEQVRERTQAIVNIPGCGRLPVWSQDDSRQVLPSKVMSGRHFVSIFDVARYNQGWLQ